MPFTEQEAKKLGQPLYLLNNWEFLMQKIWEWAVEIELPGLKNGENEIHCTYGIIGAYFVNCKYIELEFKPHKENEPAYFKMYYMGNIKTALYSLASYMEDINNLNLAAGSSKTT